MAFGPPRLFALSYVSLPRVACVFSIRFAMHAMLIACGREDWMAEYKDIDRKALLDAFDRLGQAAVENGAMIDIVVYRGSALMFASNFRFATGDVDIAPLGELKPDWFDEAVAVIAGDLGFKEEENWLNDAVAFHLSRLATRQDDHWEYGTFPRTGEKAGMRVYVPTAEYMLALKLKAMRVLDPVKGRRRRTTFRTFCRSTKYAMSIRPSISSQSIFRCQPGMTTSGSS